MRLEDSFTFGKYKGRTLRSLITGELHENQNLLIQFFEEIIKFFTDTQFNYRLDISDVFVAFEEMSKNRILGMIPVPKVNYTIVKNYLIANDSEDPNLRHFRWFLLRGFKINVFEIDKKFGYDLRKFKSISKNGVNEISPTQIQLYDLWQDIDYISWCLKEIPEFHLDKNEIDQISMMSTKLFTRFEVSEIRNDLFEIKPVFEELILKDKISQMLEYSDRKIKI